MTKRIASLIGLALLAAVSASAQRIKVEVPFSFVAAGTTWNPGTYKIELNADNGLAVMHSNDSGPRTFLTQAAQPQGIGNRTLVRFQRYGNDWVLRAIVVRGTQADVLPGKLERELAGRNVSERRILIAHVER